VKGKIETDSKRANQNENIGTVVKLTYENAKSRIMDSTGNENQPGQQNPTNKDHPVAADPKNRKTHIADKIDDKNGAGEIKEQIKVNHIPTANAGLI
jgi:hypothetical protein